MKSNQILSPSRVREMMAAMQPVGKQEDVSELARTRKSKVVRAYEMIQKTGCTLRSASLSWKTSIHSIVVYARENELPNLWNADALTEQAKAIVKDNKINEHIRHGLKQRVAYQLALKIGVSEACRKLNIDRRGLYYYCERYELPTPLRATGISK